MELWLSPRKATTLLGVAAGVLVVAHLVGLTLRFGFGHPYVYGLVPFFDLDREHNLPSLFSAALLLLSSALLALVAIVRHRRGEGDFRGWGGLAILFLLVCGDEALALHERLILPLQALLGVSGFLFFAWVIPYGLLVALLAGVYLRFLYRLPAPTRNGFWLAAGLFLSGAIGLEMLGGRLYEHLGGIPDLRYSLVVTLEELLEMAGVLVFIHTLLRHLESEQLCLRVAERSRQSQLPPQVL
ncbi:MAG: hypothetical protein IH614_12150 [Desulfuromonadales bacterium]|nr:hypothetical protein [Desulfuromonadales bacterium]